jgi:hypothetical protein
LAAPQLRDIVNPLPSVPVKEVELMSWITLVTVLVVWPLVGLGVAYLFGRFIHGVEVSGNAGDLAPPLVSHLRHVKRAKTSSRATTQTKARREATGGRRFH